MPEADELATLTIALETGLLNAAKKTTLTLGELIANMKASGMSNAAIRQVLLNDLNTGGPLFGAFRNAVKNTVSDSVGRAGNIAARRVFDFAGIVTFRWVVVSTNTCPDCDLRHGDTGTMEYFESIGLPKSGFSVCGGHCQCVLVPESYKGENLNEPLFR